MRIVRLFGSNWTFIGIVIIFALQGVWLATTSRFPMAFDEGLHFGLIRFFAHHPSPLITSQPPDMYQFGSLVHNTSLLYHYLLSFPYRLIELFTTNIVLQVIALRLINVGLAVVNLLIAKRLLQFLKASAPLTNLILLVFAFTPIEIVLASQINYDNLLLPLITLAALQLLKLLDNLRHRSFDSPAFVQLVIICLFASLVQYSFLPILAAISSVLLWQGVRRWRQWQLLWASAKTNFLAISQPRKIALILVMAVGASWFIWLYGVNIVRYHNPVPECDHILNVTECHQYNSWAYVNDLHDSKMTRPITSPAIAIHEASNWYFTGVFGEIFPLQGPYYFSGGFAGLVTLLISVVVICFCVSFGKLRRKEGNLLILLYIALVYVLFLFAKDYDLYRFTGFPAAIDGRYFGPILLLLYTGAGISVAHVLNKKKYALTLKILLGSIALLTFMRFGGALPYRLQIDPNYGHLSATNNFYLKNEGN